MKKNLLFFLLIIAIVSSCKNVVEENKAVVVKEFDLLLDTNELNTIYKDYKKDIYIPVKVVHNGDTVKAKMRLRGDTSRGYDKKSMKIVFSKDSLLQGEKRKINLNSEWTDKTYIRQYISSELMNMAGLNAFNSNYVAVSINGEFFGLFLQVENVDEQFLADRKLDQKGNLYKATHDGACLSMFEYKNPKIKWEKKTNKKDTSFVDLQKLIYDINNVSDYEFYNYLKTNFEYDKLISLVSMNMLIQNGSTYYHNYYLYHDINGNGKWQIMPWDMDKSLRYYSWKPYIYNVTSSNWESDNPLIERMFLNEKILAEIKLRIKYLSDNYFNNNTLNPIVDEIRDKLEKYVKLDETDQINNIVEWKEMLNGEKQFVENQTEYILNQIDNTISGFKLYYMNKKYTKSPKLYWASAKSKNNKKVTYKLFYGKQFILEDSTTVIIENIVDTTYQITEKLPKGIYYWRVIASDGETQSQGFNTKSTFEIVERNNVIGKIDEDMTLTKEESPYFIVKDLIIPKNITLTIEQGSELIFAKNITLLVKGDVKMLGTKYSPVILNAEETEWGAIYIDNETGKSVFKYVIFNNGAFRSKFAEVELDNVVFNARNKTLVFGEERLSLIWVHKGKFTFKNCEVYGSGNGESLNINFANTIVENSYLTNIPDAIELMNVSNGIVRNNIVCYSQDDAIDMNGCENIVIENNLLYNNKDKGISIGTEQFGPSINIIARNNIIKNNKYGISVKDSSFAVSENNFFIANKTDLEAHLKNNWKQYKIGGNISVENCYFINTENEIFKFDSSSKIEINNSFSTKPSNENIKQIEKTKIDDIIKEKFNKTYFKEYKILDFIE